MEEYKEYVSVQRECVEDDYYFYQKDSEESVAVAVTMGKDKPAKNRLQIHDGSVFWTIDGKTQQFHLYQMYLLQRMFEIIQKNDESYEDDQEMYQLVVEDD